jgi:TonB family protein
MHRIRTVQRWRSGDRATPLGARTGGVVHMKLVSLLASIVLSTAAGSATAQNVVPDRAAIAGSAIDHRSALRPPRSAEIQLPKPLKRGNPRYPNAAFRKGIEGSVLLEFSVDADGHVVAPGVVDATPPGVFERAALDAVSGWSYQPLGVETKGMRVRLTFRKRGYARWTPTPPSSTIVRGDPSPASVASDSLAQQLPTPAPHPERR